MADVGTNEASKLWGYTPETIRKWCQTGKIDGATQDKKGSPWHIPKTQNALRKSKVNKYWGKRNETTDL